MRTDDRAANGKLAQLFLRYASPLAGIRRWPVIGPVVSWAGAKIVPRETRVWMQIQNGPAKGLWLLLNPRTGRPALEGKGEPEVQKALAEHLRPGMTFYDVGANIGFFSLFAARHVGSRGRVISFEADPEIAARLREHMVRNEFQQIAVEEKAVWSEPKTVYFSRTDVETSPDRGLGHVVNAGSADTIEVAAVSLDDYAKASAGPDFIKCDVEGAEVEVFQGAQRILAEKRPGILCEMHSEENRRVLLQEFMRFGYVCTAVDEQHVLALPR